MKKKEELLDSLNDYLTDRFNYKKAHAYLNPNSTINFRTKKVQLYIRLWDYSEGLWEKGTIVFAQIGFKKERVGHGSHLMKFVIGLARRYEYKYIGIESVNDNSRAFALKLGFKEHKGNQNYLISVGDLDKYFRGKSKKVDCKIKRQSKHFHFAVFGYGLGSVFCPLRIIMRFLVTMILTLSPHLKPASSSHLPQRRI